MSRYTINLTGRARDIWEKIPKGVRSTVVSRLIIKSYEDGNLDLWILEKIIEGKEVVKYERIREEKERKQVSSVKNCSGQIGEQRRGNEVRNNEMMRRRKKEAPEWIQDIESKIVKEKGKEFDHVELKGQEKGQESQERRKEAEVQEDRGDNQKPKKGDPGWLKDLESKVTKVKEKINRFNL